MGTYVLGLQKEGACSTEDNREAGTSSFSFAAAKTTAERKMQLQKVSDICCI